jgi:hypothetical protein
MLCDDILGIVGSYVLQFRGGYHSIAHEIEMKVAEEVRDGNGFDTFLWTEGGRGRDINLHPGRKLLNPPEKEVRWGYLQPTIRLQLDYEFKRRVNYGNHLYYFTGTIPKGIGRWGIGSTTDVYVCYPQSHKAASIFTKMFGEEKYLEERKIIIESSEDTPETRAGWIDENAQLASVVRSRGDLLAFAKHLCKLIVNHDCSQGCSICDTTDYSQLCGSKDHLFGQMHCKRGCYFM